MIQIAAPRQTVLITCRSHIKVLTKEVVKDNIITIDWHMPTSFNPELYAISIGKTRFSMELIRKSRAFVVNFMPYSLKDKVLMCGRVSGKHVDKFKETGLTKAEAEKLDCPRIKEALAWLECEVINEIETGDHIIFIGKVVKSELMKKDKRVFHIEGDNFTTTLD